MAEASTTGHGRARVIWAAVPAVCGVVLLVAGKTTAGVACLGAALVLVAPLRRLVAGERRRTWVRGSPSPCSWRSSSWVSPAPTSGPSRKRR